ncbi:MAG: NAD(P)-dependent glycerol-3-phosphate dehydrogenase [Akkermansia sp.]|nr:NAD(P)-dependent glycerol-3-phosphate dehydrogenase [Akkermansia sp.]MBQ2869736.1 NAD(P)-dependent glycerol-3-phosphate dehydrogenase [Akkermansia sp.]
MERVFTKTAVIGAGAWGTALAFTAAQDGSEVVLWTYKEEEAATIRETRMSLIPVKGARPLPENVKVTSDWADVAGAQLVIVVVPSVVMRSVAQSLADVGLAEDAVIVTCSKGIEKDSHLLMSEIISSYVKFPVGSLSGPNHAEDIVQGLPSLTLVGFDDIEIAKAVQKRLSTGFLRIYASSDVVGMQIGGAIKNVFALASGICAGLGLGDNARAALSTRGLAEMTRLGMARGGRMETFMGLSGMGDLVVTCYSDHSRNLTAGRMLAKGMPLDECLKQIGQVVEGVPNTLSTYQMARSLGVRTPIVDAMYDILYNGKHPSEALQELMVRDLREENVKD